MDSFVSQSYPIVMWLKFAVLKLAGVSLGLAIIYVASRCFYNIFLHPLAKFPGPKRAAASNIWYAVHWLGGKWTFDIENLHRKYGPVVRIGPNDLSFTSIQSVQDIYGHANFAKGRRPFLKYAGFYNPRGNDEGIVSELDPEKHRVVRRDISHAFSAKALREQSFLVEGYIDTLIGHMKRQGNTDEGIDVGEWVTWLTFDIIGDLAFGEPFGAVAEAKSSAWVNLIYNSIKVGAVFNMVKRIPIVMVMIPFILPKGFQKQRGQHMQLSRDKLRARMAKDNARDDFFSHILTDKRGELSEAFLLSQAQTLIIAGSETTTNTLTAGIYYLLKNPDAYRKLRDEVRGSFKSTAEINIDSTQQLPYLFATIEESLRIFSPVVVGLPRVSPGTLVDGQFVPPGTIIQTANFAASRSPEYFVDPLSFHPERWLPPDHPFYDERFANDQKDASKPFSIGPRGCIGVNLAYMEMRIIFAKLVWEFDWELRSKDLDWDRDVVQMLLWKKPQLFVRFIPVVRETAVS